MMKQRDSSMVTAHAAASEVLKEVRRIEALAHEQFVAGYCEEAHYQAVLYSWLQTFKIGPCIVEAPYPGERWRERCDLAVLSTPSVWIELKKAWRGHGNGWNPKPAEQLRNLLWDCAKLLALTKTGEAGRGIVLTLFYHQETAPFCLEKIAPSTLPKETTLQQTLLAWTQHKQNWNDVAAHLNTSKRMQTRNLRTLYIDILERISQPVLLELELPSRGLGYSVVGSEIGQSANS